MNRLPRITVLTPALNAEAFVGAAVESVLGQDYPDTEHIVLDGGSTDGTLDVLARYPGVKVLSGPDGGPHDAMNRGVAAASGEIVTFLNADDLFPAGVFAEVGARFAEDSALDILAGASAVIGDGPLSDARTIVRRDHAARGGLAFDELFLGVPAFNVRFFRRTLFDRIGGFDLDFSYAADRHFLIRARLADVKAETLKRVTCVFRSHARSRTIDPAQLAADDIIEEHLRMARLFAAQVESRPCARRLLRRWHAFESLRAAWRGVKHFRLVGSARALAEGFAFDPAFPISFVAGWRTWQRLRAREDHAAVPASTILQLMDVP